MVSEAYAMAGQPAAGGQSGYEGIIMLVIMFAIFYLLLIRPPAETCQAASSAVGCA